MTVGCLTIPNWITTGRRLGDIRFWCVWRGSVAGLCWSVQLEAEKDEPLWQMAEFFILRKYRAGIGREVAHRVFVTNSEGRWQVIPQESNLLLSGLATGDGGLSTEQSDQGVSITN